MKFIGRVFLIIISCFLTSNPAFCADPKLPDLVHRAITLAGQHIDLGQNAACLTNAGYGGMGRADTAIVFDTLAREAGIRLGKGNLLSVHDQSRAGLWMAFVAKKSSDRLMMVLVRKKGDKLSSTLPVNVKVDAGTSFAPFEKVLGDKAFSLVTLANGWADQIPWDMMGASLFHDHLCCGIFTGHFTTAYIRDRFPLAQDDRYTYIGVPAWCQDDYIIRALNLTPGKHGYVTMSYPWNRPWKTREKTYGQLGGIILRFNKKTQKGQAWVLGFDWHIMEFKTWLGRPDMELDWAGQPWLHVLYNRYCMGFLDHPENFVSILKTGPIEGTDGLNRLTRLGANPLEELLGPDPSWSIQSN